MELLQNPTYFWGLIGVVIVGFVWLYRRTRRVDNEFFDNEYFDADPLLDDMSEKTVEKIESITDPEIAESKVTDEPDEPIKKKTEEEKPINKSRPEPELIIALFVLPDQEEGFLGTDIFTVLQDQGMSYGKLEIFHHYGVGEIKVKDAIFSVANILNPGTFNPKEMDIFRSAGLVFFMQLPGAFGGRVAFELMLNTAKRVAENLEGTLTNERQYILDQEMIDALRDKISRYELEKEEQN